METGKPTPNFKKRQFFNFTHMYYSKTTKGGNLFIFNYDTGIWAFCKPSMEILTYKAGLRTDVIDKVMNTLYWKVPEVPLTRGQIEAFDNAVTNYYADCKKNMWVPVELSTGEYNPSCGGSIVEYEHMLLRNQNGEEISVYATREICLSAYSNTNLGSSNLGLLEMDPNIQVKKGNIIPSVSNLTNDWGEIEDIPNLIWENGKWK